MGLRSALATLLQIAYQLPASSLNISYIIWRCALGHCPVVGGNWLQSSALHRIWHGVAKWSDGLPYLKSLLPCTNLPLHQHQSSPRPSHYLHHAWQMASGTPPASFHLFCVSQMFCVIQTPQTLISLSITLFSNLPLSNVCVLLPISIFSFYWPVSDMAFSLPLIRPASQSRLFTVHVDTGVLRVPFKEAASWGPVRRLFLKLETLIDLSSCWVVLWGLPLLFLLWFVLFSEGSSTHRCRKCSVSSTFFAWNSLHF